MQDMQIPTKTLTSQNYQIEWHMPCLTITTFYLLSSIFARHLITYISYCMYMNIGISYPRNGAKGENAKKVGPSIHPFSNVFIHPFKSRNCMEWVLASTLRMLLVHVSMSFMFPPSLLFPSHKQLKAFLLWMICSTWLKVKLDECKVNKFGYIYIYITGNDEEDKWI